MMAVVTHLVAFAVGLLVAGAAARHRILKRKAAGIDLAMELRSPDDLEPCEFTAHWQVRP
ncbi:hypothetical protein [Mesorhizobium amorphae]|uniref:hypothetical protein n=1 Tax=Mesorhizobium amorphae TaxID=71433 RepID=UPI001184DD1F|nr:hypothetical protein [Mesorhizobium amorphae]